MKGFFDINSISKKILLTYNDITNYRTCFMGFAILCVITYHIGLPSVPRSAYVMTYLGVDIFFLSSGFGVCYSLSKNPDTIAFYNKRAKRIIPLWWSLLIFHLILNIIIGNPHPESVFQYFCYFTGLGWFLYPGQQSYGLEWYVPTLLLFYLLTPFLYRKQISTLYKYICVVVIVAPVLSFYGFLSPLDRAYMRIPVYIYGLIMFKQYKSDIKMYNRYHMIISFFVIAIWLFYCYEVLTRHTRCISEYNLAFEPGLVFLLFMVSIPVSLKLLITIINLLHLKNILVWLGGFTLELYLFHIHGWIQLLLKNIYPGMNAYLNVILVFLIAVFGAYLVHILYQSTQHYVESHFRIKKNL